MTRLIQYFNYIVDYNANIYNVLKMTIIILSPLCSILLPLSLSLSIILVYNKFIENRELIILKTSGLKKVFLLKPLLILSIIITLINYLFTLYFNPKSRFFIEIIKNDFKNNIFSSSLIKENVFFKINNLMFYSSNKKNEYEANNIIIYKNSNLYSTDNEDILIQAEKINFNNKNLTLYNGNIQKFDKNKKSSNILFFDKYNISYNDFLQTKKVNSSKPSSMDINTLYKTYIHNQNKLDKQSRKIFGEIIFRLFFPLTSLIVTITTCAIILDEKFNRVTNNIVFLKSGFFSIFVYFMLLILFKKIKDNYIYFYILIIFSFLILIYSYFLIREKETYDI